MPPTGVPPEPFPKARPVTAYGDTSRVMLGYLIEAMGPMSCAGILVCWSFSRAGFRAEC